MAKIKDPIIAGTLIVTVGIFVASIFSYLLQFLLGRTLSISDYGTFNALLALANLIAVPAAVLNTSVVKLTTELKAKNLYDRLTHLFWNLNGFAFLSGILLFLTVYLFRYQIGGYLNISNISYILFFGIFLIFSFITLIPTAYLQGLLRFKAFAFANVVSGFLRLAVPMIFVLLGYSIAGVFGGMAIGAAAAFTINSLVLKKNFTSYKRESLSPYFKRIISFGLPVLFINLGMMLLNNLDIILVKRFFEEATAGYYSGAVTVSKILLFGAGTITLVMFPQISESAARGEDYTDKLKMFFVLQLLVVLLGVAVFSTFPELITRIMFGERFMPSVPYVPWFALFSGVYVLINFMIMFFLAIGEVKVLLLQIPAVVFQFLLINLFHQNLYQVLTINLVISTILLVCIFLYYFLSKKSLPRKIGSLSA